MQSKIMAVAGLAAILLAAGGAMAINIETVPVGNVGNTGELSGAGAGGYGPDRICGAVNYEYNIGKYEVTAGQYTEFLNAVAATDTYGLYNASMDTAVSSYGCNIKRTGTPGIYSYSVSSDWANRPVNYVSWGDAARFANWLTNGQPTGLQDMTTTEAGSCYLNGATSSTDLVAVTRIAEEDRTPGKRYYFIPTEDEWYKAAFHKNDGATVNYWDYPTGTNTVPGRDVTESTNPGNNANYGSGSSYVIGSPYYRTRVGEFELSESPYGTFDQGGNAWEWTESVLYGSFRNVRGGSFYEYFGAPAGYLNAAGRYYGDDPAYGGNDIGFRVSEVPEPASASLLLLGAVTMLLRRKK